MSDKTTEEAANQKLHDGAEAHDAMLIRHLRTTIAQLREENERYQWVSIHTTLPNKSGLILVCDSSGGRGIYNHITSEWKTLVSLFTHWMPLPSPPFEALTAKPPKIKG